MKKGYVFSTRRRGMDENVEFVSGDIAEFAADLRFVPGKNIWLVRGARLAQGFMRAGAVDEMAITIVPRLLGGGGGSPSSTRCPSGRSSPSDQGPLTA